MGSPEGVGGRDGVEQIVRVLMGDLDVDEVLAAESRVVERSVLARLEDFDVLCGRVLVEQRVQTDRSE